MKQQTLMQLLEKGVRDVLGSEVSTAEKLKAIEAGAKLLQIRHRIEAGNEDENGKFFSKTS